MSEANAAFAAIDYAVALAAEVALHWAGSTINERARLLRPVALQDAPDWLVAAKRGGASS